jgi:hypothetical protein
MTVPCASQAFTTSLTPCPGVCNRSALWVIDSETRRLAKPKEG